MSSLWKSWVNITTPLPEFSWLTLFPRLTTWNPPLIALLVYLPILNTIPTVLKIKLKPTSVLDEVENVYSDNIKIREGRSPNVW